MNYLLDKKTKRKKIILGIIAGGFLFLLFYFRGTIFPSLSFGLSFVFQPVISLGQDFGERISNLGLIFEAKKSLEKENEILKEEIEKLKAELQNKESLTAENLALKEVLGRVAPERKLILATILSFPRQSPYGTLLIDIGDSLGVKEGDLVFAEGVIPIGKIAEVNRNSSKVLLFSTPGETIEAELGGTYFSLLGRGAGNFEVETPRDYLLPIGQEALLPGITPFVLAKVEGILSAPRDAFKRALLQVPVNLRELKFVEVEIE